MKKLSALILTLVMVLTFAACGCKTESNKETTIDDITVNEESTLADIKVDSLEELEERVDEYVDKVIENLTKQYNGLTSGIGTYDQYKSSTEEIEAFYTDVVDANKKATIQLREYALAYVKKILALDISIDEQYDKMEEVYDVIYEDAGEKLYDEIYDGILKDIYDVYYDGVLKDAYDTVEYSEWSDLRSDEYNWWSDARSDSYDDWSDFRSDVYDFWSDVRGDLWDDDIKKVKEEISDFSEDVKNMKQK